MQTLGTLTLSLDQDDAPPAAVSGRIASLIEALTSDLSDMGVIARYMPARETGQHAPGDLALLAVFARLVDNVGPVSPATLWALANTDPEAALRVAKACGDDYAAPELVAATWSAYWPAQPQQALDRLERGGLVTRLGRGQPPCWPNTPRKRGAWGVLYDLTPDGCAAALAAWASLPPAMQKQAERLGKVLTPYRDKEGALCPVVARHKRAAGADQPRAGRGPGRSGAVRRGVGRSAATNATTARAEPAEKW